MNKKNKVVVHLMGHDYTMVTGSAVGKVQRLARLRGQKNERAFYPHLARA